MKSESDKKWKNSEVTVESWKRSEADIGSDKITSFILRTRTPIERQSRPNKAVLTLFS